MPDRSTESAASRWSVLLPCKASRPAANSAERGLRVRGPWSRSRASVVSSFGDVDVVRLRFLPCRGSGSNAEAARRMGARRRRVREAEMRRRTPPLIRFADRPPYREGLPSPPQRARGRGNSFFAARRMVRAKKRGRRAPSPRRRARREQWGRVNDRDAPTGRLSWQQPLARGALAAALVTRSRIESPVDRALAHQRVGSRGRARPRG